MPLIFETVQINKKTMIINSLSNVKLQFSIGLVQFPGSQIHDWESSASSGSKLSHEFISQQLTPVDSIIFLQIEVLFLQKISFTLTLRPTLR